MLISELHKLFLQSGRVSTDTRKISKGSLFFALKGDNFNGNEFAQRALDLGASFAIVDDPEVVVNAKCLLVPDVLIALQELATFHRNYLAIPIIGITGSNGKTTTKELIREVLAQKYSVVSTQGNLNNHIGVPLTLLSMNEKTEIGIVEMGANHLGDIAELCAISDPDFGIITNVGAAHLEGFGSLEGVIKTKNELYQSVIKKKGILFYNSGNEILAQLLINKDVQVITYGLQDSDFVKGSIVESSVFLQLNVTVENSDIQVNTNLLGGYNFENVLAALSIGAHFKVDKSMMANAIQAYTPSNNRSQLLKTDRNTIWVDCYNANPSSMIAALTHFAENVSDNELVVVLGDMLELGNESACKHIEIIDLLNSLKIKSVYLVGEQFSLTGSSNKHFLSVENLIQHLQLHQIQNKKILVKGSRGIQLEKVLPYL